MKITREQFENAARMAESDHDIPSPVVNRVLWSALPALGITVDNSCMCSTTVREHCASNGCHGGSRLIDDEPIWVARAWRDVREGDIIRPPGQGGHEAEVVTLGATQHWHAAPDANQYHPNESAMEWSSIPVTLKPLAGGAAFTPANGMNPDAPVQIRVTRGELAAIEACGGWGQRVGVIDDGVSRG